MVHGDDIPEELLRDITDLKSFKDPIVATLIPKFFAVHYRQNIPHEDVTNTEVKAKMLHLGSGYDLWGRIVEETLYLVTSLSIS